MRTITIGLLALGLVAMVASNAPAQPPPCQPYCDDGIETAVDATGTASTAGHGLPFLAAAGAVAAGLAVCILSRRQR